MQKQFYFLSPVEVVKVTSQNLEEVAEWCGGKVQQTESRRVQGRMDSYVWVPTPKGTNISWAFPGMFITKRIVVTVKNELRATWAVFRRDYFEKNYFGSPTEAVDQTWEREHAEKNKAKPDTVVVNVSVGEALSEAIDAKKQIEQVKQNVAQIAAAAGIKLSEQASTQVAEEVVEIAKDMDGDEPAQVLINKTVEAGNDPTTYADDGVDVTKQEEEEAITG